MSNYTPLPSSLMFAPPMSVSDDTTSSFIEIPPLNNQNVIGAAWPTTVYVANSTLTATALGNQTLIFPIPTKSISTFIDPSHTFLSFRLKHTVTTSSAGATGGILRIIGSAASFIERIRLVANGNVELENIAGYNQIFNMLLNSTCNMAQRFGSSSVSMGIDENNSFSGCELSDQVGTYYYSFSLPLLSMISLNNVNNVLFHVGAFQTLNLEVTTSALMPITSYATATPTTQPVISPMVLDNWYLGFKQITLSNDAFSAFSSTLVNGEYQLRTTTYKFAGSSIGTSSIGTVTLPLQWLLSSIKSVFTTFNTSQSAACPNGMYDSINPSLRELSWSIGGTQFPTYALRPSSDPAKTLNALMGALGSQSSFKNNGGIILRSSFGASLPSVYSGSDNLCVTPAAGLRAYSASDSTNYIISNYGHAFYVGICLERMSSILFSGANTKNSVGMQLNLVLNTANTTPIMVSSWALCDAIVFLNLNERSCRVLV